MYPNKRGRDRLYILAEVLGIAQSGALKTNIMYRANLSFTQLNEYLDLLLRMNLIEIINSMGKTIYRTTPKGLVYLKTYKEIIELLKPAGFGALGYEKGVPIVELAGDE